MKSIILILSIVSVIFANHSHRHGSSPVSCSKPSGYVDMNYTHGTLEANQSMDTVITLISEIDTKIIDYEIVVDERLEILQLEKQKHKMGNHDKIVIELKTLANQNAEYFITIYTQASSKHNPSNIGYKSLIVPIKVGEKKIRQARSKSDKEQLTIYKGMESIR